MTDETATTPAVEPRTEGDGLRERISEARLALLDKPDTEKAIDILEGVLSRLGATPPADDTEPESRFVRMSRGRVTEIAEYARRHGVTGSGDFWRGFNAGVDAVEDALKHQLPATEPTEEPSAGVVAAIMAAGASYDVAMRAAELLAATEPTEEQPR